MKENASTWFGMRLTATEKARIKTLAEREGLTAKDAILRLVDQALAKNAAETGSFLSGIEPLIGSVSGPPDLSTNRDYLSGFGE